MSKMQDYADAHNSFSLIVIHRGVIQAEWYATGWDAARPAQSQSMHKSVLPLLIQAAIERGAIESVNDSIGGYIPEWQNDSRGDITIEDLLVMSSGLYAPPFSINPYSDDFLVLFGTDITPVLLRTTMDGVAGEAWEYNNSASELLGLILERATAMPYAQFLEEVLWGPMGGLRAEVWLDAENGKGHSNCCLITTARDWAVFGLMLLNHGARDGQQIVSADFVRQMTSPAATSPWYGYQIWTADPGGENPWLSLTKGYQRTEPFLRDDTYFASGYGAQRVYVVPSEDLVIVRMGPSRGPSPVRPEWDNAYLVNTAIRHIVP
ncbi:hypothetical protein Mag101_08440 [Microbulbifer agarilyticus]|uniref:Beta-lactamase-related domain-containing protein n=1 Tax=Microbulbifer agarilyticus TaxID=260552 RepID=A0A1Q2M9X6_9GAMM|nr:hypothetical protein Mag101_08440 [Microbulbifer agarilyticus]